MSNFNAQSAQQQWRTRPADEWFTSIAAAREAAQMIRSQSASKIIPSKSLKADVSDGKLIVSGPTGNAAHFTHWSFGQLCARVGVPAGYMRDIAVPELVADCVNEAIARRDVEDIKVRLRQNGRLWLDAVNGPSYGMIWNVSVWDALYEAFGDGVTGTYKNPALFVRGGIRQEAVGAVTDAKDTTFYSSDRDMWCMLATDADAIEVPNRRGGKTGHLYQGLAIGQSDVGAGKLWLANFLFDDFCYNHLIWGMRDLEEFSIRHTASAPHRFVSEIVPALKLMARERVGLKAAQIKAAQSARINDLDAFLKSRKFNRSQVSGIKAAYKSDEGQALPTDENGLTTASIWQAVVASTAYARGLQYADARVEIQRAAGDMLMSVAA